MNKYISKLSSCKGESIAELLIAAVIIALGSTLFLTMLDNSFDLLQKNDDKYSEFIEVKNRFESGVEVPESVTRIVTITDDKVNPTFSDNIVVTVYVKEFEGYPFSRYEVEE